MIRFLDTNIFVYCFDDTDRAKQQRCRDLVRTALVGREGRISSQVIIEFCNLALRRFARPLSESQCRDYVETVLQPMHAVSTTPELVVETLALTARYRISWYDALIVAAAIKVQAQELISEDLHPGLQVAGCTLISPWTR